MLLRLDAGNGHLYDDHNRVFAPESRRWLPVSAPPGGTDVSLAEAVSWVQRESRFPWRPPVGLIGPREPTPLQAQMAETVGAGIARLGLTLICGGHRGAMEAACRGATGEGGVTIGLLPDEHWDAANSFVTVPIATGIGVARNALIARAAFCLVAVGGGHGTLSEMAFGLQFGRPVFGLAGAPVISGVAYRDSWVDVETAICRLALNLA